MSDHKSFPKRICLQLSALLWTLSLATGCATPGNWPQLPETFRLDVGEKRQERKENIAQSFGSKRNDVQLQAAVHALEIGDRKAAKQELMAILQRDPSHSAALEILGRMENPSRNLAEDVPNPVVPASYQGAADIRFRSPTEQGPSRPGPSRPAPSQKVPAPPGQASNQLRAGGILQQAERALATGDAAGCQRQLLALLHDAQQDEPSCIAAAALPLKFNQPALSLELVSVGLQRFPQSAAFYRLRGTAEYRMGEFSAAQSSLSYAVSLDKAHPLSYFLLGLALDKLGDKEAANHNLRLAAELDPRYASRR